MDAKKEAARLLHQLFASISSKVLSGNGLSTHKPQPTDIVVATYPKAGTTLLQNMCYQIAVATGGAPPFDPDGTNFEDIDQVAPWIEVGPITGITECPSNPRIFKTHGSIHELDVSKSKFILCIRDPLQFPGSMLDFTFDWFMNEKVTNPEVRYEILQRVARVKLLTKEEGARPGSFTDDWFSYNRDWTREPRKNILVLFYEEVVADLEGVAKQVANFMGRTLSDEALCTVVARCDRKVMAASDKFKGKALGTKIGLNPLGGSRVLPADRVGFKSIPIEASIRDGVEQMMLKTFGVRTYKEACDVIRREQASLSESQTHHA